MQVSTVDPQQQAFLYTATTLAMARGFISGAEQGGKWRRTERITPALYSLMLDCLEVEISALERIDALPEVSPMLSRRRNETENLQVKLKSQTYVKCTIKRIIPAMEDLRRAGVQILDLMRNCEERCKSATDRDCLYQYKTTAYKLFDLIKGISNSDLFETNSENFDKIRYQEKEFYKSVRYEVDAIHSRIINIPAPMERTEREQPRPIAPPAKVETHGRGGRREGSGRKAIEGKTRFIKMSDSEYAAFKVWLKEYRANMHNPYI